MLVIDSSKCSGCRRCEVSCSFFRTGKVGRTLARVRVVKVEGLGIDFPLICQQCSERYCLKCPESAIEIGPLGQVIVSPTLCTTCGTCQIRCPIGAIELVDDIPRVCDLCGGEPRCVQACSLGAISFEPDTVETVSLSEFKKAHKGLGPEEKRVRFVMAATEDLRKRWSAMRSL